MSINASNISFPAQKTPLSCLIQVLAKDIIEKKTPPDAVKELCESYKKIHGTKSFSSSELIQLLSENLTNSNKLNEILSPLVLNVMESNSLIQRKLTEISREMKIEAANNLEGLEIIALANFFGRRVESYRRQANKRNGHIMADQFFGIPQKMRWNADSRREEPLSESAAKLKLVNVKDNEYGFKNEKLPAANSKPLDMGSSFIQLLKGIFGGETFSIFKKMLESLMGFVTNLLSKFSGNEESNNDNNVNNEKFNSELNSNLFRTEAATHKPAADLGLNTDDHNKKPADLTNNKNNNSWFSSWAPSENYEKLDDKHNEKANNYTNNIQQVIDYSNNVQERKVKKDTNGNNPNSSLVSASNDLASRFKEVSSSFSSTNPSQGQSQVSVSPTTFTHTHSQSKSSTHRPNPLTSTPDALANINKKVVNK